MPEPAPARRSFLSHLFSDEWQMPIALSAGVALLIGYSLQVLVNEQNAAAWVDAFHAVGHALVWVSLALGAVHGLKAAGESIAAREPNIDVLMVVGAGLAAAIGHPGEGALLLFMFTLAGALEHRAMAKAKDAVARLSKLMPNEAMRRTSTNGGEGAGWEPVKPEDLRIDDLVLVRPGETVPADGVIEKGQTTLDQSHITGESLPRAVERGDEVYAGTMNQNGAIEVRISRPVAESSLQKILELVLEAQEQRQPLQRVIDKFSTPYTLSVFAVAAIALVLLATTRIGGGEDPLSWADAAYRAITLLIVASPCALVIATPTATLCGLNRAARAGLLVKGGEALERLSSVNTIALDKTGTLTTGRIEVVETRVITGDESAAAALLPVVLAMEEQSTHPIAMAIARSARHSGARPAPIDRFEMVPGKGIRAMHEGEPAYIGNIEYIAPLLSADDRVNAERILEEVRAEGAITAVFAHAGTVMVFTLADTLREGAKQLVAELHALGIDRVVMLTGDHENIAAKLGAEIGVDEVHAGLLPEDKVEQIRRLRAEPGTRLAVVGDGVNDAPALAMADVGLAMGGIGTDAALEAADVVILNDDLAVIPWAIRTTRRVRRVMYFNIVFAMSVILILAAFTLVGWIPMGVGVIGHEGSTLIVVAVSLMILTWKGPRTVAHA
jgi:Zn2+/Cd2+-exporting ATPase